MLSSSKIGDQNPFFWYPQNSPSFHSGRTQPIRQSIARPKVPSTHFRSHLYPESSKTGRHHRTRLHHTRDPAPVKIIGRRELPSGTLFACPHRDRLQRTGVTHAGVRMAVSKNRDWNYLNCWTRIFTCKFW